MPTVKSVQGDAVQSKTSSASVKDDEREDRLDCSAATEAINEALEKSGIKKTRNFDKERGLDFWPYVVSLGRGPGAAWRKKGNTP